jgi:membrane associated rhomboid family serine protease
VSEAGSPDDFCYRHPDRRSYILCQRCGRTICPECQTQAAVGVHCPECVREARASQPRVKRANPFRRSSGRPVVTISIIALCALVFVADFVTGGRVNQALMYYAPFTLIEPWRALTAAFTHGGFIHIALNMYSLYIFGSALEQMLGRLRFAALYLISALGGSVAVLLLAPGVPVVGASGAIFGLFAAFFVIQRRLGIRNPQIVILLVINMAAGFFIPNVSWQAHLGGAVVGALVALVFMATRHRAQRARQIVLLSSIVVALAAVSVVRLVLALQ